MRALLLVLCLSAAACAAVSQAPADGLPRFSEAQAVCSAVAEGRAEFMDVANGYVERDEETWTSVDVDNDGTPEDVAILSSGTSVTPAIYRRVPQYEFFGSDFYEEQIGKGFAPWAGQLFLISHRGRVYEVFYSDRATLDYPVYVGIHLPNGQGRWLCSFQPNSQLPRLTPLRENVRSLCEQIERTSIEGHSFITLDDRDEGFNRFVREVGAVDFMNDGTPRQLVRVLEASGAGAGCDTEYLAVAGELPLAYQNENLSAEARVLGRLQTLNPESNDRYAVRLANGYVPCHGNIARFHQIGGSVVFEERFPGERPLRRDQEFWWVTRVENGQPVKLCEATTFAPAPRAIEYNHVMYPQAR